MMNGDCGSPTEQAAADVSALLDQLSGLRRLVNVAELAASDLLTARRGESAHVQRTD
jgi:hypothetical protein